MSVFFGIYNRNGKPVDKKIVHTMLDAMSYWNPDEHDTWTDGPVALGHTMLWNTPESKFEHLPLQNSAYILTMDARIDNRDELVNELELPDRPLEEIGDSEFILAAYKKWGEDCPKYLLGDFAFVILDIEKKHLFCARDPLGIKLFHYYLDDELFVFANDIIGLLSHPNIPKHYNEKILSLFLRDNGIHTSRDTFFNKIKKLPGGTSLIITAENVREQTYWKIENINPIYYETYQEYVDRLRSLLEKAVEVRLRTVYPVVSHLSGGIDSSPISVLAVRKLREKNQSLHAYNWINIPREGEQYETEAFEFSRRIAALEQIKHHEFAIDPEDIAEWYDQHDIFTQGNMSYLREYYIQKEAMNEGARSILSGWGGDELISYNSYSYIAGLFQQRKFIQAFKALYKEKRQRKYSWFRFVLRCANEMNIPLLRNYIRWRHKNSPEAYEMNDYAYVKKEFIKVMQKYPFEEMPNTLGIHQRQVMLFYYGHIQNRIESWALTSFSKKLEYSYPLLDRRIAEFAMGIPEELFFPKDGHYRHLMRSAVSNLLPHDIAWFPKASEVKVNITYKKQYGDSLRIWYEKHKNDDISAYENHYVEYEKIISSLRTFYEDHSDPFELNKIAASILIANAIKKHKQLA